MINVAIERRFAQKVLYLVRSYLLAGQRSVEGFGVSELSQSLVHLFLKLSDTTLTSVLLHDFLYCGLVERRLFALFVESAVLYFAWYEVAFGYFYLLFGDVSAHLYQLHTVE